MSSNLPCPTRGFFFVWILLCWCAVAQQGPRAVPLNDKFRKDLKAQESRNDGYHFDQSYDLDKEDTINRLGLLFSDQNCRISPPPLEQPEASYYIIECPKKTRTLSVEIGSGHPFKEALSQSGKSRLQKLTFDLKPSGETATQYIQACVDAKAPATCRPVQLDAKAAISVLPAALKVVAARSAQVINPQYVPGTKEYVINVFENEPIDITLQVNARDYADRDALQAERGFVNETTSIIFRPRGPEDSRVVYLTDREHGTQRNVTIKAMTTPSFNPQLWDLRPSVGRLDPTFQPSRYAYFLRVPEGSKQSKLRLTAMDDVHTECSYLTDSGNTTTVVGKGVTGALSLGSVNDPSVLVIECHHPNAPEHSVRYMLQTVQQKGGTTLLKDLDVIGGDVQQPFVPENKGLYTVNMLNSNANDQPWVSFRAIPRNPNAQVDVEGYPVDESGHSPYFKVPLGETRKFRIGVRTPENPVKEVYTVSVSRPASKDMTTWMGELTAWMATCASTTRAYHFLNNMRLLQWISVTSRLGGVPESWISFARHMNVFNWQFEWPAIAEFVDPHGRPLSETRTPLSAMHDTRLDSHVYGSADSYVSPPTPYGIIMNKFALSSVPLALEWDGGRWVSTMTDSAAMALSIEALEAEEREASKLAFSLGLPSAEDLHEIENPEFFGCALADDCSSFVRNQDFPIMIRKLSVMSPNERAALRDHLENSYRNSQNVIEFARSLTITSFSLLAIGAAYLAVYYIWLRKPSGELGRVYPRWLHPVRFWLFVIDLACISYAQSCCGLAFSDLRDTPIRVLGITTTPGGMAWLCVLLMIMMPVIFLAAGTALISMNSGSLVFSKVFHKHHDQQIGELKAFWQPLPFLPLIGRLFDVEIAGIAPILRPPQNDYVTTIILNEEQRKETPWLEPDCRKALQLSDQEIRDPESKPLNGPDFTGADLKHYLKLDAVKVHIDCDIDEAQTDGWLRKRYDNLNAKVTAMYPNAFLAWSKQPFTNLYSQPVQVDCAVLLRHMSSLVTSCAAEKFDVIAPRENLHLISNDKISNLIATSHRSNLYFWCFDRLAIVGLVVGMSAIKNMSGRTMLLAFGVASGLLLCVAIPGVLATSASRYWQQMEADKRAMEKTNAYEAEDESKFDIWPYKDPRARAFFAQKMENDIRFRDSSVLWRVANMLDSLSMKIVQNSFFKTRTAKFLSSFFTTYAFTELAKMTSAFILLLGSTSTVGDAAATRLAVWVMCLAILCLNYEAFCTLFAQLRVFAYESYIEFRRLFLFSKDCLSQPSELSARLHFYASQVVAALSNRKQGGTSFIFPGFQAEVVRDFTCYEVNVVNNEVGVLMPGVIADTNRALRKMADENNALALPRYGVQKTLFQAGTVGVYRSEIDRSLPVQIPFTNFCNGTADKDSQLVATIHVVNHASLRYVPLRPHEALDDSYLSLYTDPSLVPPSGKIRRTNLGHGYAVKIDNVYRRLTIKGPGILSGKYYSVKLTTRSPPGNPEYEADAVSSPSSTHIGKTASAACHCNTPGVLLVDVPQGAAPDLQEVITITPPDAGEEPFEVDPAATHIVWDSHNRVMVIRTRGALLTSDAPYLVTWSIKQGGQHFTFSMDTPTKGRGLLLFLIAAHNISIGSDTYIAIRDSEKSVTIDIDPKDTNAHEFSLSAVTTWHGPGGSFAAKHATFNSEMDTLFGSHSIRNTFVENIPCTIVQCVDPVARKYRVEPDFYEALRKVAARQEELLAMRSQLQNLDCLPDVWYHVMSPAEFVKFWAARGLDILDDGHRFVDPTREPDHPKVRTHGKIVREGELHLRMHIEKGLQQQEKQLNALRNEYSIWLKAYSDSSELCTTQADLEEALSQNDFETAAVIQGQLKMMKKEYSRLLPHFLFPMIVEEKMLNKVANWEAQLDQWDRQVDAWLSEEENASTNESMSGGMSCHDFTRLQIMHALRYTTRKPENLLLGRAKTVLHYVTSSRSVRGLETQWRPDPLGAMFAYVRVWLEDARGRPDFRPESAVWRPCLVKLTGRNVKIMMPSSVDRNLDAPYPWRQVSGWYIPLKCFERIECTYDSDATSTSITQDNVVPPTMIGKLVFRRSLQIPVDDDFVKDIVTDEWDNWFNPDNAYESCVVKERIMIGESTNTAEARNFPPQEYHSLGDHVSAWPLTFKLFPQDLERWRSVIWACGMYRPPRDVGDFSATRYRDPPPQPPTPPLSESSQSPPPSIGTQTTSSASVFSDPTTSKSFSESHDTAVQIGPDDEDSTVKPVTPPPPERIPDDAFDGDFQDWRFAGEGRLRHGRDERYEGGWKDGLRYGANGHYEFKDNNNSRWTYDGGFWMDDFSGPGKIVLEGGEGAERLQRSGDPRDRHALTGFEGDFQLPPMKKLVRGHSAPYEDAPLLGSPDLADLFSKEHGLKRVNSDLSDTEGAHDGRLLVLDDRDALSACGDEAVLSAPLKVVSTNWNEARAFVGGKEADDNQEFNELHSDHSVRSFGDGRCDHDEYLGHAAHWTRALDPSLGFGGLGDKLGRGIVTYADGCRFLKEDDQGLVGNRPNGRGFFYCPRCPMKYDGRFLRGRPEGKGCMKFLSGADKIVYDGEFKDGQRHGFGKQACYDDKIYVEGQFANDRVSGGQAKIVVADEKLIESLGFKSYVGEMENGVPHGKGKLVFRPEREKGLVTYSGYFQNGFRHGNGTMYDAEGNLVLDGAWVNDMPQGRVTNYKLPDGKIYCGTLVKGELQGLGELFHAEGHSWIYEGAWFNNVPHGRGTLQTADGVYEGEFSRGKRDGKGTFSFNDGRRYEGDWKDDRPHGIGLYSDGAGGEFTYEFKDGKITKNSKKQYKTGGACSGSPNVADPIILECPINQHNPRHWGRQCFPKPEFIREITTVGQGMWEQHERHPMEYADASGLGSMPDRPVLMKPREVESVYEAEREERNMVMRIKVKRAEGLPVMTTMGRMDPYCKVLLSYHQKSTKPHEKGHTDPVWEQTFKFRYTREKNLFFSIYNKSALTEDTPIAQTVFQLASWLDSGRSFEEFHVGLVTTDKKSGESVPAGTLVFGIELKELGEHEEISEDSYASRNLHHEAQAIHEMRFDAPEQRSVSGTRQA